MITDGQDGTDFRSFGYDLDNLEVFHDLLLDLRLGVVGGSEPGLGLPLLVHHELGEVPLDGVHEEAALLVLQVHPERVGRAAVHLDLAEHVERHVVSVGGERLDLLVGARFLTSVCTLYCSEQCTLYGSEQGTVNTMVLCT